MVVTKRALLLVDVQNDFCSGGSLAVPDGDRVIPTLNKYIQYFSKKKCPIFASRDWHPKETQHFQDFGGLWPAHCVQKTKGAQFHPKLKLPLSVIVLSKGMDPNKDSYSAFQAVGKKGLLFEERLSDFGIEELYVGGLATDYCVRASCLDALRRKIKVILLTDAIQGVNLMADDSKNAIDEILHHGGKKMTYAQLRKS